jgi:hypothetical protein
MARKINGYYNESAMAGITDADQLIIAISKYEIVCLVKSAASGAVEGFEIFSLEKSSRDWNDVFYEVRATSQILNRQYKDTHCYYNFEEAVIIPEQQFTATAAEDFLDLLFGEDGRQDIKHDMIASSSMVNAYRIKRSVHELVSRHFLLYKPHHVYSGLVEEVLSREELPAHFIKAQFYTNHIIVMVVKDRQFQLIQSFDHTVPEDIVYYLGNLTQQFAFDHSSHIEISGMFDKNSSLHQQLVPFFGNISFDEMQHPGIARHANHPAHYFTPFYKLIV